jgi:hypothetical protein
MTTVPSAVQDILDRIQQIESPTARRVIGRIADGVLSGRIAEQDAELIAGIAEHMAAANMRQTDVGLQSLTADELSLVHSYRCLTPRQQEGAHMILGVFKPPGISLHENR